MIRAKNTRRVFEIYNRLFKIQTLKNKEDQYAMWIPLNYTHVILETNFCKRTIQKINATLKKQKLIETRIENGKKLYFTII